MILHRIAVRQPRKLLLQLDAWIATAVEHAAKIPYDPVVLLSARLAPDQYPLVRQVQSACDNAKFGASRLSLVPAPRHPDTEATIDELRARIHSVADWLDTVAPVDFQGAEARDIPLPFAPGKVLNGADYLIEMALPNFYFHVTTAYAILRHNGVPLGKWDYLGPIALRPG